MPKAGRAKTRTIEILHQTIENGTQDHAKEGAGHTEHSAGLVLSGAEGAAVDRASGVEILHETIEGENGAAPKMAEAALDVLHQTIESEAQAGGAENVAGRQEQPAQRTAPAHERPARQVSRMFAISGEGAQQAVRQATRNAQVIAETGTIFARGFRDISREWVSFAQSRVRKNVESLGALARCRTPQDFVALQRDFVRDNLEGALNSSRRVSEISAEIAGEAVRKIADQGEENARQVHRAA